MMTGANPSPNPSVSLPDRPTDAGPADLPRCPCCHWRQLQPGDGTCELCAWPLDRIFAPGAVL